MLALDRRGVAAFGGGRETLRQRLDRRAVAEVLEPLLGGDPDALLLLLDVRHRRENARERAKGSRASYAGVTQSERRIGSHVAPPHDRASARAASRLAIDATPPASRRRVRRRRRPRAARGSATRRPRASSRRRSSGSRPGSRACSGSSARWSPAYYFGAAGRINAFTVAFQVPNLVRALVADAALSSAFVPVFSELLEKGERQARVARRLEPLLADAARPRRALRALHPRSRRG